MANRSDLRLLATWHRQASLRGHVCRRTALGIRDISLLCLPSLKETKMRALDSHPQVPERVRSASLPTLDSHITIAAAAVRCVGHLLRRAGKLMGNELRDNSQDVMFPLSASKRNNCDLFLVFFSTVSFFGFVFFFSFSFSLSLSITYITFVYHPII